MSRSCGVGRPGVVFTFVFFFQAEDGIRDKLVTGVQTCALPIYLDLAQAQAEAALQLGVERFVGERNDAVGFLALLGPHDRSEERRVGKECRSRWSPYH